MRQIKIKTNMATVTSVLRSFRFCYGLLLYFMNVVFASSNRAELYTMQNFQHISSSSYPHFVMFYAPWCGHCKRIQPLWDKFAEENHETRRLKVAKVDCTETTRLCASEKIKAYPTFRLFSSHEKYTYGGNRNIAGFNEFVNNNIQNIQDWQVPIDTETSTKDKNTVPDNTPVKATVLTGETFRKEIEEGLTFVDFYAPWCPHCVQLEPVWNELATHFKYESRITIAKVDCTAEPHLCQAQDINAYPSLKLFKNGRKITDYQQSRELVSLVHFVESALVGENEVTMPEDEFVPLPKDELEEEENNYIVPYVDAEIFSKQLLSNPHLVYFHNEWFQTSKDNLELFSKVTNELRRWDPNVISVIVDCVQDTELCSKFKITAFPSVLHVSDEENYVRYHGDLTISSIVKFAVDPHDINNEKKDKRKVEL